MKIRRIALSLLAVSALAVAACGTDSAPSADPIEVTTAGTTAAESTGVATETTTDDATSDPAATSTAPAESTDSAGGTEQNIDEVNAWALQAISTAEAAVGGAAVKIDDEDFDQAWEVDVLVGDKVVEVKVNSEGTEALETKDDESLDDGETAQPGQLAAALEAAFAHTPGVIDGAELEEDDGTLYWGVDLDRTADGDDVELRVNVDTLEVTPDI